MTRTSAWSDVALSDAVDFLDSQRRPVKVGDRAKMRGGIPYYGASGVVDHVDQYLFDEPLILLGEDGENILSRAVPLAFKITGKSWVNNHAHVLRPRPGFDIDFLTAYLESRDYSGLNSGTAQPKLNKQSCSAIRVVQPPIQDQRAIAAVLLDVDNLIKTLDGLIAKQEAMQQGMMQQLLTGETRLPGFSQPWQDTHIADIALVDPDALGARTPQNTVLDYIALEDVSHGVLGSSTQIAFGEAPSRARRVLRENDVLFGTVRPNLKSHAIYRGGLRRPIASTGFAVIRALAGVSSPVYLFRTIMSDRTSRQIDRIIAGSNYPAVSSRDIRQLALTLPPYDEQTAIGEFLSTGESELQSLRSRLAKCRAIKTGLTQELLSGKTRLPVMEVAV
jgi:type I restriction enzyme S subunit